MPAVPAAAAAGAAIAGLGSSLSRRGAIQYQHGDQPVAAESGAGGSTGPNGQKLGRNEPCWCGSGKKFKRCHGA
jgi:preprotein translocase subunit SecA